jgi:hypothetical protein
VAAWTRWHVRTQYWLCEWSSASLSSVARVVWSSSWSSVRWARPRGAAAGAAMKGYVRQWKLWPDGWYGLILRGNPPNHAGSRSRTYDLLHTRRSRVAG